MRQGVKMRGVVTALVILLTVAAALRVGNRRAGPDMATSADSLSPGGGGFIHGRVTTTDDEVYEGPLRFGQDEEALWGNHFNGRKDQNPWVGVVSAGDVHRERGPADFLGLDAPMGPLDRPFLARFGDIQLIEAKGRSLWVTLKSGTRFHLDRYEADDYADGVRIWDATRGVLDLDESRIRSIELISEPQQEPRARALYGSVRTADGVFTGLVQWDREACVVSDLLQGRTADGELAIPFEAIRSIARRPIGGAVITLDDGRELVFTDAGENGRGSRGMYVDDPRYGRVLVSWEVFEQIDLSPAPAVPTYADFQPGQALTGTVITRGGREVRGRLVYDFDETETTETLDAPARGVDYLIPFGMVRTIEPFGAAGAGGAAVTLRSGERLHLERAGDLSDQNTGVLVLSIDGSAREFVRWLDIEQITLDDPPAAKT